ncbi:YpiF family protein [Paenibacillus sp. TRM 82003]|nr:YpiF family protein [Paenibacillus sp. TRM 82003]
MKFSEIEREAWPELAVYLDTALLPLSGLTGRESPWEATEALERLRDALDPLETMYKGRVVTYPAVHYAENDEALEALADKLCVRLRESGFRFVLVVTGAERLLARTFACASATLGPEAPNPDVPTETYRSRAKRTIEALWHNGSGR